MVKKTINFKLFMTLSAKFAFRTRDKINWLSLLCEWKVFPRSESSFDWNGSNFVIHCKESIPIPAGCVFWSWRLIHSIYNYKIEFDVPWEWIWWKINFQKQESKHNGRCLRVENLQTYWECISHFYSFCSSWPWSCLRSNYSFDWIPNIPKNEFK